MAGVAGTWRVYCRGRCSDDVEDESPPREGEDDSTCDTPQSAPGSRDCDCRERSPPRLEEPDAADPRREPPALSAVRRFAEELPTWKPPCRGASSDNKVSS